VSNLLFSAPECSSYSVSMNSCLSLLRSHFSCLGCFVYRNCHKFDCIWQLACQHRADHTSYFGCGLYFLIPELWYLRWKMTFVAEIIRRLSRHHSCGHILCGSCLYSATTTRQAACQPACPVCRTPIPNLQFTSMSIATRLNPNRNLPLNVMNQYQPRSTIAGYDGAEDKWDPARSGVIGLEIMTTGDA
jgi:hypothetical protein